MRRYRPLRLGDAPLFWLVIGLSVFGIAMIYSAGAVDVPGTRAERGPPGVSLKLLSATASKRA